MEDHNETSIPTICGFIADIGACHFFLASCGLFPDDKKEDSPCGDADFYHLTIPKSQFNLTNYFDTDGTTANIRFEPDDLVNIVMCTERHISVDYEVYPMDAPLTSTVRCKGTVYWGGLYEETKNLNYNTSSDKWDGSITGIGLKQAYPNGNAWVSSQIWISIPDQGTPELNIAYLKKAVLEVRFTCGYYHEKAK
jgi:hypothetical protein